MISTQFCEKTGEFQEVESSTQSENHCDVVVKVENVNSTEFCEKTGEFQEVIVINPDSIPGTKVESSDQSENDFDVVSKVENVFQENLSIISAQFCEKTGEFQEIINPDPIPDTKIESSTQIENDCDVVSKEENVILVSLKNLKRKVTNETENSGKEEKKRKGGRIIYYNELADEYLKSDKELMQIVHDQSNKRPKKQAFQTSNLNNYDYKDQIISDRDDTAIKDLGYLACSVPGCKSICKKTEMKENLLFYTIIKKSGFELSRRQTGASADQWLKFVYSEKATKFCEISTLILSTVQM